MKYLSILFLFISNGLLAQQSLRCPVCPPSLEGVTTGWVLTDSAGFARWQVAGGSGAGSFWKSTGNSGTTAGTNFIGTTDNISLVFKTNNIERFRLLNSGGGTMEINGGKILFTDSASNLSMGIDTGQSVRQAFLKYEDDTVRYSALAYSGGVVFAHYNLSNNLLNGFINVLHYENNMVRKPGTGVVYIVSNTDEQNLFSVSDSIDEETVIERSVITNQRTENTLRVWSNNIRQTVERVSFQSSGFNKIHIDSTGNIIPESDSAVDLGSASKRFKDLYVSAGSIYLGTRKITSEGWASGRFWATDGTKATWRAINSADVSDFTASVQTVGDARYLKLSDTTSSIATKSYVQNNFAPRATVSINTTAGDAATINQLAGRFRKDTSGDTFTLTNNLITANSIIILTPANAALDATATQWTVSVSSNTATIVFDAAPTANFDMSFIVTN